MASGSRPASRGRRRAGTASAPPGAFSCSARWNCTAAEASPTDKSARPVSAARTPARPPAPAPRPAGRRTCRLRRRRARAPAPATATAGVKASTMRLQHRRLEHGFAPERPRRAAAPRPAATPACRSRVKSASAVARGAGDAIVDGDLQPIVAARERGQRRRHRGEERMAQPQVEFRRQRRRVVRLRRSARRPADSRSPVTRTMRKLTARSGLPASDDCALITWKATDRLLVVA